MSYLHGVVTFYLFYFDSTFLIDGSLVNKGMSRFLLYSVSEKYQTKCKRPLFFWFHE